MPTTDAAPSWPNYQEADFVIKNYVFTSGESLPELRLHYRTMGVARRDAASASDRCHRPQSIEGPPSRHVTRPPRAPCRTDATRREG